MADEEAERDRGPEDDVNVVLTGLTQRLQELQETMVNESQDSPVQASLNYCQDFCRALLEAAGRWRVEEEPLPVIRVYLVALRSYAETSTYLSMECDSVPLVMERLALSFVELLLSQKELPHDLWDDFKSCIQFSHGKLQETGISQLSMLWTLGQQEGIWTNPVLQSILSGEEPQSQPIEELLVQEGHSLLELRVKQLRTDQQLEKAARLAKVCSESALCEGKANFKQMYLVCLCLCTTIQQEQLMEEISKVDCRDALEMICNLESEGDEKGAFTLCSAFLSRQLLQADAYCAWELTLFWSKLLKRLEPSEKAFLDKCCQMSLLSKTVYHLLFLIKVIQSEINEAGLPVCIEMCIRALRMQTEDGNTKATVFKTIACLLPNDLEVKRACQLSQFLQEPTVDSYYAVETLYNEPDQKLEEEKMAVPNSLRCELLLVFKTQWPFDPEFWDWKTLKRRCLALMGEEASIVSSIDTLNDTDDAEEEDAWVDDGFLESADRKVSGTYELTDQMDKKQKNREMKKLREKGFISARFRNWQVYMQYCVLCDKEFLGHRIIRHAQIHIDRGVYSCPICTQSFTSKETLIPHVTSHVKQSSKDRLTAMKASRKLANPKTAAPMMASLFGKTENEASESGGPMGQNAECFQNSQGRLTEEPGEEVVCPVGTCKKTFKFYRNLIAHVKAHRDNEEAKSYLQLQSNKVVCQYCRRHFISVNHLNDHLQVHCGTKPYICIQLNCKASFLSNTELLVHRKTHSHFKARCMFPNCSKIFSEAFKLYDHEAKHYKTFTCKFMDCGTVFHTQQQLDLHHNDHTIKKEISPKEQTLQSSSSLNETPFISDTSTVKEVENLSGKYRAETVSVGKPETLENLLKASQTPIRTVDRFEIKTEVQEDVSISEASPSVNMQTDSHPAHLCYTQETPPSQTPDHLQTSPKHQKPHISPFEATINKMLREKTLLQSELQFFSNSYKSLIKNGDQSDSQVTSPTLPPGTQVTPMTTTQSVPMATTLPIPMGTTPPIPMGTTPPFPMATTPPFPVATTPPIPMATTQPIAMGATTAPIPMTTTLPVPMAPTQPIIMKTQPIPLVPTTQPIPMGTTWPAPMPITQPIPMTTQPFPVSTTRPVPIAATQHIPVATTRPLPLATARPIPMATTRPVSIVTTRPVSMTITQPFPMATTQSIPMSTTHPIPMATTQPFPMATTHPIPMATTQPFPMATTQPFPMATTQPFPMATTQPFPMATTQPFPMATTRPVSMATTQPIPMVATQSFLMATTRPIPMPNTQRIPMVAPNQSIPVPTIQSRPTAEKLQVAPPTGATSFAKQEEKLAHPQTETFLRERYHCPFEMCTRNYSCYKSVSKHIKTSHPDMYAIRRIPRSEIRVTYVSSSLPGPKPPQKKPTVSLPHSHTNMETNSEAKMLHTSVNATGPQLMEHVLNPIVVSQLKTATNQQSSLQTLNQPVFPMATPQKVDKCGTAMVHLPRPPESTTASVSKGLTESNPAVTVPNSIQVSSPLNSFQPHKIPAPSSSVQLPPHSQAMWSTSHQNQQMLSSSTCQLHPTRLPPSTSQPLPPNHQPAISIDPNVILANSLTKAYKDMQSSALYRPPATSALPQKTPIKTEEENLPLWSPASEIKHVQRGTPLQTPPHRAMGDSSAPLPFKDHPRGIPLGSALHQTSVISNQTSNTHSPLPLYTPPLATPTAAPTSTRGQTPNPCHPPLSHLIQKTHKTSEKRAEMLSTVVYNTNVPIPAKDPHIIPENNTATIPATSMQTNCKPPATASIKTENCQASSHRTPHTESNALKNTNIQNPPSQPVQKQDTSDDNPENGKPVRKRNKIRWSAIVRDGKVFCPLCYRSFKSTKSLGGHLSKRLRCNPFDEMELNSDLPGSFLDFLNSDPSASNSQHNHTNNPHETYHNKPHTSKSHGPIEQTSHRPQKCQDQLDEETSEDALQQIMTASNMSDLCVPSQLPQIQKASVSPGNSFQNSTGPVEGGVQDVCSSSPPYYPQTRPPGKRYPTPLLSQALKENQTSASVKPINRCQGEIHSKDQVKVSSPVTPMVQPKNPPTNKTKYPERSIGEQNIKKKLREQILAGDFQRRNNLSHLSNACHNFESQSPMSCSSETSSKNEDCQLNWDSKANWPKGETPAIIPGTVAEIEELLKTHSFTSFRQNSATKQGSPSPTSLSDNVDNEPGQLSLSQQQWFSELQAAFVSLDLIRESPEPDPVPVDSDALLSSSGKPSVVASDDLQTSALSKIFSCVSDNCGYSTLSSAAFWRHLNKIHEYGFDQINAVKQKYGHCATFQCQICPRTFTRNPNLKTHYISAHQLSIEEIEALDMKRKKDKAAMTRLITVQSVQHEFQHQNTSGPGRTSVIQALPSANMHSLALKQTEHERISTEGHCTNGQRPKVSKPFPNGCPLAIAHLPQTEVSPHVVKKTLATGKQANRPAAVKTSNNLQKKSSSSDALNQYRPYRCVHKDCEAAFTIQHNLILHYRAVHQSALSALEVNKEQDQNEAEEAMEEEEEDEELISEFRCQVKDCSRIFQEVPHLMQHYLRLHEFTIDKVGDLLSVIRLGRFTCGHGDCTLSFTAFWKYVAHIKELHKDIKLSKPENMYKCEIEGCDRAYATKSNMLRHLMKKHNDYYLQRQPKTEDGVKQNPKTQYQLNKTSDGKENIESHKTSPQKDNDSKRTRKINNYWTKYEKPVLKSKVEACAMCTKSYPLQYPCMIKGCESVMNSEKSILKHYTVHGLSEKFLEQHRSHYIFCKKFPRQKNGSVRSDDSKSDQSSDSEPELMGHNGTEETREGSRPFLRKRTSSIIPAALLDSLSNDDSSDSSLVIKRKRGRPKKIVEKIDKRRKVKESETRDEGSDSSEKESISAFKPMGFEMSFLKFLEQSNKTQPSLTCEIPLIGPWVRLSQLNTKETCVKFNNPQNLKSLDNVKIVVDRAFVGVSEIMLKQLQDMQPMVLLGKK